MKSSDVYKASLQKIKSNPAVQTAVGTPIKEGMFISGNVSTTGAEGSANLSIPISGPKGKAKVYINASKETGRWVYSDFIVEIEGSGQRINLLE